MYFIQNHLMGWIRRHSEIYKCYFNLLCCAWCARTKSKPTAPLPCPGSPEDADKTEPGISVDYQVLLFSEVQVKGTP